MPSGAEHYREAEELIACVTNDDGSPSFGDGGDEYVALAQVHATLALAAATAMAEGGHMPGADFDAWAEAAGVAASARRTA